MDNIERALAVPRSAGQDHPEERLQPLAAGMVLHRQALHEPFVVAHAESHQERPQPAVELLREGSLRQRAVPQPRPEQLQRSHIDTARAQPCLLSLGTRPVQLQSQPEHAGKAHRAYPDMGRYDAQTRHQRLRDGQHRIHRVLASRPVSLRTAGRTAHL